MAALAARRPWGLVSRESLLSRQAIVFFLSVCAVLTLLGNLVVAIPVAIPELPDSRDQDLWPVAATAALFVATVAGSLGVAAYLRRGRLIAETPAYFRLLPGPLKIEVVPWWAVAGTAALSFTAFLTTMSHSMADWQVALAMLVPWLPVLILEVAHRYRADGFFAMFLVVSLLQVGHLGEHTAQVMELVVHNGNLDRSHGVFGQLDFETVHFFWDSAIWLVTAALLYRYPSNGWLWVSFTFASLHEVEHIYLYYVFLMNYDYYMEGGLAGIMGKGGVIGSPLFRPYLHFLYNFLVTVPMVIGLWMQPPPDKSNAPPDNPRLTSNADHPG